MNALDRNDTHTMMKTIRADQVGSLLRPPELLHARAEYQQGHITLEQLRQAEDRAILDALEMQKQVDIDVFSDGEYRRADFMRGLIEAVEGFVDANPAALEWHSSSGVEKETRPGIAVGGKLRPRGRLTAHEAHFLSRHAPGTFKITIPSAALLGRVNYRPGITDEYYPSPSALMDGLAGIIRNEIQELIDERVSYIQIDAPNYTSLVDPRQREHMRRAGMDPEQALDETIAADNASVAGLTRKGTYLAIHLCRGNSRSQWLYEGGYEPIAEKLFRALDFDRFLLEYDGDRAGGFEPLRFVPANKTVVLGLITTKEGRLETRDEVLRRIEEASQYIPLERVAISPQCGFASSAPGNLLTMDDQQRKLELVVEVARHVWG
jgi:5-methyltetrahydropteroyltriglutamate--homocysteine methyltransferase